MTATKLDGVATASAVKNELKARIDALKAEGVTPGLGTLLVGSDPGSLSYVAGKHRDCAEVGIESIRVDLPETATADEVRAAIRELNENPAVTGYIIQLPLPAGIDENAMLELMDPDKDADGLHPTNLGRLVLGVAGELDSPLPCTPAGVHGSGESRTPSTPSTRRPRFVGWSPSASLSGSMSSRMAFSSMPFGSGSCTM